MSNILWLCGYLVFLHAVHSYILLTANLEDFNAIAKQVAASPVAGQINQIFKRASNLFSQYAKKSRKTMSTIDDVVAEVEEGQKLLQEDAPVKNGEKEGQEAAESNEKKDGKQADEDKDNLIKQANNKNASFYLSSIKKIFEDI